MKQIQITGCCGGGYCESLSRVRSVGKTLVVKGSLRHLRLRHVAVVVSTIDGAGRAMSRFGQFAAALMFRLDVAFGGLNSFRLR